MQQTGSVTDLFCVWYASYIIVSKFCMNGNIFSPGAQSAADVVAATLVRLAHMVLILTVGFLPILFIPGVYTAIGYIKVMYVIAGVSISLLLLAFAFLRSGSIPLSLPKPLAALWAVALAAVISSLLSGDIFDSLAGDTIPILSATGLILVASLATLMSSVGVETRRVVRLFLILLASAVVLCLWHVSRLIIGPEFLSFGLFGTSTGSLLGSWNDVALFYGLVVILSLIAVEQLTLSRIGRLFFGLVIVFSLIMLAVINFFAMWLVLGFLSLAFLMYSVTRHRFAVTPPLGFSDSSQTLLSVSCSSLVFAFAVVFVIGGTAMGTMVSNLTGVSYVEVRPSFTATLDIARATMDENVFTGVGPNRFTDAWRLHKDVSLNETLFWNTEFNSGYSFLMTAVVETGLVGLVAWLSFLILFVWVGVSTFVRVEVRDRAQYYVLVASFTAGLYIWVMCAIYVPGTSIILLGAAMTGIFFGARRGLVQSGIRTISLEQNRHIAFLLVGVVMAIIILSLSVLYVTGRHFMSAVSFTNAVASLKSGGDLSSAETTVAGSYQYSKNDTYARELAWYQLARMNSLIGITDPTTAQQQEFQTAATTGLNSAGAAVSKDGSNPSNHQILGQIYSLLAVAGVEGAGDMAQSSYNEAQKLDPTNPAYDLFKAQLLARTGDTAAARELALKAVQIKRNYTEALAFLTDLDISEGKVEDALKTTQAIISIEPQNPARYYQLGVLLIAAEDFQNAIGAFIQALQLDPKFANARYFLGITLAQLGDTEGALRELRIVEMDNQDNENLKTAIAAVEQGTVIQAGSAEGTVSQTPTSSSENEPVTTDQDPNTDLVSPVNVVPNETTQ